MIKKCILVLVMIFSSSVNASEFTQQEKNEILNLRLQIDESCKTNLKSIPAVEGIKDANKMLAWINELANSSDYCYCLGQKFQENISPELMRNGSEQDGKNLILNSGKLCMIEKLKATTPNFCQAFLLDMKNISKDSKKIHKLEEVCSCVQKSIDSISIENFDQFTSQTVIDYREYRDTGKLSSTNANSLLGSMNNCGMKKLK